jgi:hypothetical protein
MLKLYIEPLKKIGSRDIDHKSKDRKILEIFAKKLSNQINPLEETDFTLADKYLAGLFSNDEFYRWISYLYQKNLIQVSGASVDDFLKGERNAGIRNIILGNLAKSKRFRITIDGWNLIHNLNLGRNSKKVFVAMAFTDQAGEVVRSDLRDKIKNVLEANKKWEPIIIDEIEHNDGIMDKVISGINDSRFVIAELTHQKSGVYYEAGYARGIGLPVIHIVKKSDLKSCHFDVKHLNLITWDTLSELAEKLEHRIKATII